MIISEELLLLILFTIITLTLIRLSIRATFSLIEYLVKMKGKLSRETYIVLCITPIITLYIIIRLIFCFAIGSDDILVQVESIVRRLI